jgi:hypothetical protein
MRQIVSNKRFILEPLGGLGNRMRVLSSMLWLNKIFDSQIICYWINNEALNASFETLFEPIPEIDFISKPPYYKYYKSPSKAKGVLKLTSRLITIIEGVNLYVDDQYIYDQVKKHSKNIIDIVKHHKKAYFKTCEHFGDGYSEIGRFKPVKQISDKISLTCSQFNHHTIGIHIRGTDHKIAQSNSPLKLFIKTMEEEIVHNKQRNFFISTDEESVEQELFKKFGKRIIVHNKVFSRNTLTGVQDAVVDMFSLAKTSKIIGSYWSSFNYAAAKLGNVPLLQIKAGVAK